MKKSLLAGLLLLLLFHLGHAQKFGVVTDHYDLKIEPDYSTQTLSGVATLTLHNISDSVVREIPFLLYRLMRVGSVTDAEGGPVAFEQNVTQFEDFGQLQVNYIRLKEEILPGRKKTVRICYSGWLLGYAETGMRYITDRISEEFTLIRTDSYAFPLIGKPSSDFVRRNFMHDFTHDVSITVPDHLTAAMGDNLAGKESGDGKTTFRYTSKVPSWRMDIAIAPYREIHTPSLEIFYCQDSLGAAMLADYGGRAFDLYKKWWGPLNGQGKIVVIQTERHSGGQADKSTIILPEEGFPDQAGAAMQDIYHELSHLWNVPIREQGRPDCRWTEGLATFCQYLADETLGDEKNLLLRSADSHIGRLRSALEYDPALGQIPLIDFGTQNITHYAYGQGMIWLTILYHWFGEETFHRAIGEFYRKYTATGASTRDFTDCWIAVTGSSALQGFFDEWIYGTGYVSLLREKDVSELIRHYKQS